MIRSAARDSNPSFGKMVLVVISQAITALMSLLISFLLARWTQKTDLGEFFFYNGASTVASSLIASPLGMWLTRSQNLADDPSKTIRKLWIWICVTIAALAAVMTLVGANALLALSTLNCSLIVGIALFTFSWNSSGYAILFAAGTVLPVFLRFAMVVGTLAISSLNSSFDILLLSVLSAFTGLVSLYIVDKSIGAQAVPGIRHLLRFDDVYKHLKTGKQIIWFMLLSSPIYTLYQFSDKAIAKYILGYAGTADISLLMQWSYLLMTMGLQPFVALAYPRILQAKDDSGLQVIRTFSILFGALTAFSTVVFSTSKAFLINVLPSHYADSIGVLWIGILAGGVFMIGQILSIWFSRSGNEHGYLSTMALSALIGVSTMYIGAKQFGIIGIVCGHLLFSVAYVTSSTFVIQRSRGQRSIDFQP